MAPVDPSVQMLLLGRVTGLVVSAPLLGHAFLPARVRVGLALALTVLLGTFIPAPAVAPGTPAELTVALFLEVALGVMLGTVAQFMFAGVQLGGQLAGVQMGFGFATLVDPASHAQTTVVAELQQLVVLLVFLALDMHHVMIAALVDSFRVAPVGAVVLSGAGINQAVQMAGELFVLGLRIAAPVLLVLLLANVAMGVMARTVPQLNVFVIGFPVNVGLGLMVMGAALPLTIQLLTQRLGTLEPSLANLIEGLVNG